MTCSPVTLGVASSRIGAFSKKLARVQCLGAMHSLPKESIHVSLSSPQHQLLEPLHQ